MASGTTPMLRTGRFDYCRGLQAKDTPLTREMSLTARASPDLTERASEPLAMTWMLTIDTGSTQVDSTQSVEYDVKILLK